MFQFTDSEFVTSSILIITAIGGLVVRDRAIFKAINSGDREVSKASEARAKALHERINTETVKRPEVQAVEDAVAGVREEIHGTNARIDKLLLLMADNANR
jgi:hypothetical protein